MRTSESKGHEQRYDSSAVLDLKFLLRTRRKTDRNFKSTALVKICRRCKSTTRNDRKPRSSWACGPCRRSRRGSACRDESGHPAMSALTKAVVMLFDRREFLKASAAAALWVNAPADLVASAARAATPS